jgi:MGT family glycosyltransferase
VVPQIEILRRAAAFLTHAGMNGVQEALCFGVPLVMAPQAADQFWISARVAELGAGCLLHPLMPAGAIRGGVAKVLSGARYTAAASRIGASLRTAGGHMRAAAEIQSFIGRGALAPPDILGTRSLAAP